MKAQGKAFDELSVGDSFGQTLTIDESHISRGCGLFGDFNPLHSDAQFAAQSRFGQRILHGPMTGAAMSASVGMFFHGTAVAYLEHNCRFLSPVFAGDTLSVTWSIAELSAKPQHNGGIAAMTARCVNQRDQLVAEADGKILLLNRGGTQQ